MSACARSREQVIKLARTFVARVDDHAQPIPLSTGETHDLCQYFLVCVGTQEFATGVGSDDPHDTPELVGMWDERQLDAFAGDSKHLNHLEAVLHSDSIGLQIAEKSYGSSWKVRGGVGAFMMLARKWDRLHNRVKEHGWNVFKAIRLDKRREGVIDDIRDLRRYLTLVECEMIEQKAVEVEGQTKDSPVESAR